MSALAKCKALVLLAVPSSLAIVIEALELFKIFVDESDPLTTNLELPPTPLKTLVLVVPIRILPVDPSTVTLVLPFVLKPMLPVPPLSISPPLP